MNANQRLTSGDGTCGLQLSFNEDYTVLFGQQFVGGSGDGAWYTVNTSGASPMSLGCTSSPGFRDLGGASMTTQNFSGTGLDLIALAGRNGKSQVTVCNGQTNASIISYNTLASQAKPNSPVYAAASALGSSPIVDTDFMSQGEGGKTSIKKVNVSTGVVDPTFAGTYNGKPLVGPLRIATNLRPPLA